VCSGSTKVCVELLYRGNKSFVVAPRCWSLHCSTQGNWEGCVHLTVSLRTLVAPIREWSHWLGLARSLGSSWPAHECSLSASPHRAHHTRSFLLPCCEEFDVRMREEFPQ
jgi:hypothetical protein